jgi:hypothetical protein
MLDFRQKQDAQTGIYAAPGAAGSQKTLCRAAHRHHSQLPRGDACHASLLQRSLQILVLHGAPSRHICSVARVLEVVGGGCPLCSARTVHAPCPSTTVVPVAAWSMHRSTEHAHNNARHAQNACSCSSDQPCKRHKTETLATHRILHAPCMSNINKHGHLGYAQEHQARTQEHTTCTRCLQLQF